ncbi:MAG: tetratricopeptide repeat protein [Gammaproteobacteria bacterium]
MHATEEEQVEALKKWWKQNGTSVVSGLLIGLAVLLGGKAWFGYQERTKANASNLYAQMMNALEQDRDEEARNHANAIISGYSNTGYAPLTALALARIAVNSGELEAAQAQLQWAIDHSDSDAVKHMAQQRLVRVMISLEDYSAAQQLLGASGEQGAYHYRYAALRGDLAKAQGQLAEAALAYKEALDQMPEQAPDAGLIRVKYEMLANLIPEPAAQ